MKNSMILVSALLTLLATGWLAARGPQEGVVEGRFAEGIDPGERTVYLVAQRRGQRKILDSVRLAGPQFTLRGAVSRRGDSCRIEFSQSDASLSLLLSANMTARLRITVALPEAVYLRAPDNERAPDSLDRLTFPERMRILQQRADSILNR